jgi:hypothetical protein
MIEEAAGPYLAIIAVASFNVSWRLVGPRRSGGGVSARIGQGKGKDGTIRLGPMPVLTTGYHTYCATTVGHRPCRPQERQGGSPNRAVLILGSDLLLVGWYAAPARRCDHERNRNGVIAAGACCARGERCVIGEKERRYYLFWASKWA